MRFPMFKWTNHILIRKVEANKRRATIVGKMALAFIAQSESNKVKESQYHLGNSFDARMKCTCDFSDFFPLETTPDEEPVRAEVVSESSDTGDEDIPTNLQKKEHASFKAAPEIIQDKGVSGSAATSDTAPSVVESSLAKKPLKSALKKPKNPVPLPLVLNKENDELDSPDKPHGYGSFRNYMRLHVWRRVW